ncbi:MAG TPA: transposase [bacterium]|nr:transposase [bacterium]
MKRRERRAYEKRWRKDKKRALPSASTIRRYLEKFHHPAEEKKRVEGTAFIPTPNDLLQKLLFLNTLLMEFAQRHHFSEIATLDQDATLVETHKRTAFYSYQKLKSYQPFNTYWHEQGLLIHSEFRDGNVPAGYEQLRVFKTVLEQLPATVKKVYLRSDSAGYQEELLRYCAEGQNERFGVIEFAIAARVSGSFKQAVMEVPDSKWEKIYRVDEQGQRWETNQEWAEVCFVPNWMGNSKQNPHYRYLAIRERLVV